MKKTLVIFFLFLSTCWAQETYVVSADCPDHSNIREKGSLAWALTQIGNNQAEIKLSGNKMFVFKGTFSIPDHRRYPHQKIDLSFADNAVLYVAKDKTLTLKCSIKAKKSRIFIGEGNIKIDNFQVEQFYPEWWGAKSDGVQDNAKYFTKMIESIPFDATVQFSKGIYLTSQPIKMPEDAPMQFVGVHGNRYGLTGSIIKQTNSQMPVLVLSNQKRYKANVVIRDMLLTGGSYGIYGENVTASFIERCWIYGNRYGVYLEYGWCNRIRDNWIINNKDCNLFIQKGINNNIVEGNIFLNAHIGMKIGGNKTRQSGDYGNVVQGNSFEGNDIGLMVSGASGVAQGNYFEAQKIADVVAGDKENGITCEGWQFIGSSHITQSKEDFSCFILADAVGCSISGGRKGWDYSSFLKIEKALFCHIYDNAVPGVFLKGKIPVESWENVIEFIHTPVSIKGNFNYGYLNTNMVSKSILFWEKIGLRDECVVHRRSPSDDLGTYLNRPVLEIKKMGQILRGWVFNILFRKIELLFLQWGIDYLLRPYLMSLSFALRTKQ